MEEFGDCQWQTFLDIPNNICLSLNIDWFNPFDESPYSAGAIYLVVLNLPRTERYQLKNLILVGIIPGPKEPKRMNPFLNPLVKELNELYNNGFVVRNHSTLVCKFRAMLCLVTCDLPATRKVCGYLSFNAEYGCSKCLKQFLTDSFGQKPNYGGYDYQHWPLRDYSTHVSKAKAWDDAKTQKKRIEIEKTYGIRYSELLNLPGFDIVRYHVIDPMHNMFLGIAKHTTKTWRELKILGEKECSILQEKVDSLNPPSKLGRIPRKVGAMFMAFTADEWKYWIVLYSLYALHGVIPNVHYNCWAIFVESCRLFCLPVLCVQQIERAHYLLVVFCTEFERLYGSMHCTPNMHMAVHIKENILDYGPLSSFWVFAFERYNGVLQHFQKSWLGPEKQMLKKLLSMQHLYSCEISKLCQQDELLATMFHGNSHLGAGYSSIDLSSLQDLTILTQLKNFSCSVSVLNAQKMSHQVLIPPCRRKWLSYQEVSSLKEVYTALYPGKTISVPHIVLEYKQILLNGEEFISLLSRSKRSSAIVAHWPRSGTGIDLSGNGPLRVGLVKSFLSHQLDNVEHVFACVQWYRDHSRRDFLHPSIIICSNFFENFSSSSFVPVCRLCRCAITNGSKFQFDFGEDNVVFAVPLLKTL